MSIALKARYVDGREFGLQLEDLAYSIDNRLELRCLLPLPGLIRLRDGSLREGRQPEQSELDALKKSLAVLEDAGWQARLIPDRPLVSSLTVDSDAVIYFEYLNDPPGAFFSTSERDVEHYVNQFETHWNTFYHPSRTETLYDELLALLRPTGDAERDGGRDILAFHETPIGRLPNLVECKRHQERRSVGIAVVQRLYGVLSQERATAGLVVTTSKFSKDALTFAETVKHQLRLKDYEAVKKWLADYGKA